MRHNWLNGILLDILFSLMKLLWLVAGCMAHFILIFLVECHFYSLRDEKVKIRNFLEEIMPEQYNDG